MTSVVNETNGQLTSSKTSLVRRYLELLQAGDIDSASSLLASDVRYVNVSLPTIQGRDRVRRALHTAFGLPGAGFEVYFHSISEAGGTVLTERTDVLLYGPVRIQIWVCGRFDVVNGEIALWKDYFDWWNFGIALIRGLLGALLPAVRPKPPQ